MGGLMVCFLVFQELPQACLLLVGLTSRVSFKDRAFLE